MRTDFSCWTFDWPGSGLGSLPSPFWESPRSTQQPLLVLVLSQSCNYKKYVSPKLNYCTGWQCLVWILRSFLFLFPFLISVSARLPLLVFGGSPNRPLLSRSCLTLKNIFRSFGKKEKKEGRKQRPKVDAHLEFSIRN